MYFELTEEQIMIRQAARDFAQHELKPGVIERDEHQKFPTEQIKMLGELGFLGMMVSPRYGGSGMDAISYVLAMEELSKIGASNFGGKFLLIIRWFATALKNTVQKHKRRNTLSRWQREKNWGPFVYRNLRQGRTLLHKGRLLLTWATIITVKRR